MLFCQPMSAAWVVSSLIGGGDTQTLTDVTEFIWNFCTPRLWGYERITVACCMVGLLRPVSHLVKPSLPNILLFSYLCRTNWSAGSHGGGCMGKKSGRRGMFHFKTPSESFPIVEFIEIILISTFGAVRKYWNVNAQKQFSFQLICKIIFECSRYWSLILVSISQNKISITF